MITPLQIKTIHIAAKQAGLSDEQYRMVLKNTGGVYSCKQLDQKSFEDVMAVFEEQGFREKDKLPDGTEKPSDYWRGKVAGRGRFADARQVFKIIRLAEQQRYSLPQLCERFSDGRTAIAEKLTPQEAWNLIEMLKAVNRRELSERSEDPGAPGSVVSGPLPVKNASGDYQRPDPQTLFSGTEAGDGIPI